MKLPVGVDDFKELIEEDYQFIDKSLFINDVLSDSAKVILITRPRRFGKTINMSMLYYYLTSSLDDQQSKLFDNLAIAKDRETATKHYHQHPTIFLTFKEVKKPTFREAIERIKTEMSFLYEKFRYLLDSDKLFPNQKVKIQAIIDKKADQTTLEDSLKNLTEYLYLYTGKKPIILLDEYDTPVHAAYNDNYYKDMVSFLRTFLGAALKGNNNQGKAIVTGITRITQESIFSGLNNFKSYSVLEQRYGEYFGFTEQEMADLLLKANAQDFSEEIKSWYNGYNIGGHTLYNPWSILNCLSDNVNLKAHWINSSDNIIIKKLINTAKPAIKEELAILMQGGVARIPIKENLVFQNLEENEESIWALLLYSGYLTITSCDRENGLLMAQAVIPNREVMFIYNEIIREWFTNAISLKEYNNFIKSLVSEDLDEFKSILSDYISKAGSYFDFNSKTKEQVFHGFILGLVLGLRENYIIKSNQEAGRGRFDVVLIPKDKTQSGIVLEFKTTDNKNELDSAANMALKQIIDQKYTDILSEHGISNMLLIGLAFCGQQLALASKKI